VAALQALSETKRGCKLHAFLSDQEGEFNSIEFKQYYDEYGVKHFTTTSYTPLKGRDGGLEGG